MAPTITLTTELASRFARIALGHLTREYPNKLDHVLRDAGDVRSPRALHPLFYGSFDWHSCVHGYWLLARLLRMVPSLPERDAVQALFDAQITEANVAGELAYLREPGRGTFERPYGWAWALALVAELARHGDARGRARHATLAPLGTAFAERFVAFLPRATYPVRSGTHANTAFSLALAWEYAERCGDRALASAVRERALRWYANDAACPAWEPDGEDFLSPALVEAECMRRLTPRNEFAPWLHRFLPDLAAGRPQTLFRPAAVSDRTDGRLAHLDGLNLSRAWCFRAIATTFEASDPLRARLEAAAGEHLAAALPHLAGDYAGEHWLATFAALALTADAPER